MSHYALIDDDNVVINVFVGSDENDLPQDYSSWEEYYSNFYNLTCLRTSYNTQKNQHLNNGIPFRGNYAGIGYLYLEEYDIFVPPKEYESWILDLEMAIWVAPLPYPDNENNYSWNEESVAWEKMV